MAWRVVIAGGGFGGLYAARRLERLLPPQSAQVTLVADANFLLYTPLLPGAASGTLEPRHVVVPLREELDSTDIRLGRVTGGDALERRLDYVTPDGRSESLGYDQLIVALGSVSRVVPVPGLAEYGMGFKTIAEAIALRNRALVNLEIAETLETPEERRPWLTFMFVGAGYAGLEGIAELQDYVGDVIHRYPRCRLDGTRWILVEAGERIMPEIHPGLAEFAARELRGRGIDIRTRTTLDEVTDSTATLSTGEQIPCRTLVWTAGVRPSPVVAKLGLPVDAHGRIPTDEYLRVPGYDGVWAIGDAAAVPDPAAKRQRPTPPTAQHALRQGRLAGANVAAALGQGHIKKFTYKTLGVFVDMGRHQAVAEMLRIRIRGFPAWFAARTYHLALMPGPTRRLRLMVDWTVAIFFGRGGPELGQLGHPPSLASEAAPSELTASG
ncbi:MAG TPA: NAD(P)/FAD-dependent oxidoreductase [Thermoleophilaceae bacterium]|nr:NAD(P)/FAD-dependent oxidoreductase [Thermoleophilaceae bacterium]